MIDDHKRIDRKFSRLIADGKHGEALLLWREKRELIEDYAIGGLTWVQHAIDESDLPTIQALVAAGFDITALDEYGEQDSLSFASRRGNLEIMDYCISQGITPPMDDPLANPLFACMPRAISDQHPVHGKDTPPENYLIIAKKLLDHGIDSTVRYDMPSYGGEIDAMMFALLWYREDISRVIADHQASGDAAKAEHLLSEAKAAVDALGSTEG